MARRGLHRKYGCESIYQFAAKIGAMGHDVTCRVLALHKKLQDKPLIWNHFRKFGWAKLRVVADILKVEDQEFWLDKLERLPKKALEEYVRTFRNQGVNDLKNDLFSFVPGNDVKSVDYLKMEPENIGALKLGDEIIDKSSEENFGYFDDLLPGANKIQIYRKLKFNVNPDIEFELKKLKQEFEKEKGESVTMGEALGYLIEEVKRLRVENKELKMVKILKDKKSKEDKEMNELAVRGRNENKVEVSRYIPVEIKEEVINKHHGKCAFPNCNEPFVELHHSERFTLVKNHENLKPLCHVHHQMMHAGVVDEKKLDETKGVGSVTGKEGDKMVEK